MGGLGNGETSVELGGDVLAVEKVMVVKSTREYIPNIVNPLFRIRRALYALLGHVVAQAPGSPRGVSHQSPHPLTNQQPLFLLPLPGILRPSLPALAAPTEVLAALSCAAGSSSPPQGEFSPGSAPTASQTWSTPPRRLSGGWHARNEAWQNAGITGGL